MSHIDHRVAEALVEARQLNAHLHPQLGVQVAEGFIEQEDPRIADDGAADRHALALAAGELTWLAGRTPVREVQVAWRNYIDPLGRFNFIRYFQNSFFVTTVATIITLIVNSMAAFALSKYEFRGRTPIFVFIIATLMIPLPLVLVPVFLIVTTMGLTNSLWGVIIPTVATPTGVFLLRQYMLTIPDELIDAARMDNASEWRIYWRIVMPLSLPALAVLAIFSIMWRWNDFLWPLIVLTKSEKFTLQVGLNAFQGEFDVQWHFVLAMTVLTLLPITLVFAFLQRFITTGIANTGLK